ncbi:MAG: acyl-CoA synthetase, partial [Calditrichaeota bacterium]
MKSFKGLYLGKQYFSREWIVKNFRNLDGNIFLPYQFKTLLFCGQWLTGQESFTIHTSGTTGAAKPVQLSRRQMIASAQLTGQVLNLSQGDRALVCLSPDYIAGLMMLVRGMELGLEMVVVEPQSNPFAEFTAEEEIQFDFTAMVPLQLQTVFDAFPGGIAILNRMKAILLGGAPVSEELKNSIQKIEAPVYHTFGMTETASHVALRRLNGREATEKYYPLPGIKIGTDERGCLWIRGAVTDHKLITTNDLVELDSDGGFFWLGRLDNVINTGGIKVPAEKIEQKIDEILHLL